MKTNKITTIVAGLCILLLLGGCNLDRYPYDSIVEEDMTEGSYETMTLGNYSTMKAEYFFKTIHQYGEYGGDNVALSSNTSDFLIHCYRYERIMDNYYPKNLWQFTYTIMNNINTVIPMIEAEEPTEALNHLAGENYFLRALLYLHCCNVFGRPYLDANGPENNLGIPIKTTADPDYAPPRATVKQVYDQIVEDGTKAARLMQRSEATQPKHNVYATQEAAWALLSRVYLYMGEYATAEKYCDSIIDVSKRFALLEDEAFKTYPRHIPEQNTETIFAIRMTKDVDYEKYYMASYSVGSMYAKINDDGWGEMYPSQTYLDLIRQHPEDKRMAFIDNQVERIGEKWIIYVRENEANKAYDYMIHTVELQDDGTYKITDGASNYESATVQQETDEDGRMQYFVVTKEGGIRHDVLLEDALEMNNAYPKRYILKCSQQENQAQLYSPVMFRLAEIYLNRAECRYHTGNLTGAVEDINEIRRRAGIPERTLGTATTEVLDWALDERRLELAWEGHRRYDIFRNRQTLDRRYPGTHLDSAEPFLEMHPDDLRVVEFIPQSEIDAYPGGALVQNP